MDAHGTNLAEKFAAEAVAKFFQTALTPKITNQDYEGEIKDKASRLNILTFSESEGLQNYDGTDLTLGTVNESEGTLVTDQQKAYYFKIKSIDVFKSYVEDPESTLMSEKAGQLQEAVDAYVLGLHTDVASGNRVGTNYTTGTVTVTVTTGAVTGDGTTFTSGMVGKGFKAAGHSVWYRIKTYSSGTAIVIEDDSDDDTSAYTGGAISAGASYIIEANTAITLSASNAYTSLLALKKKLDEDKIPKNNRWVAVNSHYMEYLLQAGVVTRDTEADTDKIANGFVTRIAGFDLYETEQLSGDSTNGWWALAGHKSAITFAMAFTETGIEDLQGNFGKAYKGLNVYGAKVVDERRKALATLYFK